MCIVLFDAQHVPNLASERINFIKRRLESAQCHSCIYYEIVLYKNDFSVAKFQCNKNRVTIHFLFCLGNGLFFCISLLSLRRLLTLKL